MHLTTILTTALAALAPLTAAYNSETGWKPKYCVKTAPPVDSPTLPRKFGFLLYRAYDSMDVFGTLEAMMQVSWQYHAELYLISDTLDPVTTAPLMPAMNRMNSTFYHRLLPTHTFATAPRDLDVLLVPGGPGARSPDLGAHLDFIREMASKVKYFMSVCTGAMLASNAGVLDGKRATTNKLAWNQVVATAGKVDWIAHARWVVDGTTWTTSGVSSGVDGMLAFIECIYGPETAETVTTGMEWRRVFKPKNDPFAALHNDTNVDHTEGWPV